MRLAAMRHLTKGCIEILRICRSLHVAAVLSIATLYLNVACAEPASGKAINSGEETFQIARGGDVPVITVETRGRKLQFMLNTAFQSTAFANRHRGLLGSRREPVAPPQSFSKVDPECDCFDAPRLLVGRLAPKLESVVALDLREFEEQTGCLIDGFLGFDVLRQCVVQFDFHRGILRLLSAAPADSGEAMPLSVDQYGLRAVELSVGGESQRLFTPATMLMAPVTMRPGLFTAFCRKGIVQLPDRISLALAARPRIGVQGIATTTQLGGFVHRQALVETDEANYLGLDYLARYLVTFDFPREKAYFKKSPAYDFPAKTDQSGLTIVWRGGRFVIDAIRLLSPAFVSGFLKHDVIQRINGEPAETFSLYQLRNAFLEEGKTVAVTVSRDERIVQLKIALRDYRNLEKDRKLQAVAERENARSRAEAEVLEEFDVARHGAGLAVSINLKGIERQLLMLVDTGTSASCFDKRLRTQLGTSLGFRDVNTPLQPFRAEEVRAPAARLGSVPLSRESICVLTDMKPFREETGSDFDGIMGMDYLCNQIVQIDFDAGKLRLLSAIPADAGRKIQFEYAPSGTPAAVVDVGSKHYEWFVLDSGWMTAGLAVKSQIFQELKDQGELTNFQRVRHRDRPGTLAGVGNVSSFRLGPFHHESLRVVSANDNAVSLAYLSRYCVTFDFPARAVYLKESSGYARPDSVDASGLVIVHRDNAHIVDKAKLGGPGDAAGIKVGDAIARLNGNDAGKISLFELRQMLSADGKVLSVVILRNGTELELTLLLRNYSTAETTGHP